MVVNSAFVDVKFVKKVQVFLLLPRHQFALHQMLRVLALYYCRPSVCPFPLLRHISPITPGFLSNWRINFTMGDRFIVNRKGMSRCVHVVYGVIICFLAVLHYVSCHEPGTQQWIGQVFFGHVNHFPLPLTTLIGHLTLFMVHTEPVYRGGRQEFLAYRRPVFMWHSTIINTFDRIFRHRRG